MSKKLSVIYVWMFPKQVNRLNFAVVYIILLMDINFVCVKVKLNVKRKLWMF